MHRKTKIVLFFLIVFSVSLTVKAQNTKNHPTTDKEIELLKLKKEILELEIKKIETERNITSNIPSPAAAKTTANSASTLTTQPQPLNGLTSVTTNAGANTTLRTTPLQSPNPNSVTVSQPQQTPTNGSSSSTPDGPVDPVCFKALVLDRQNTQNTNPYLENICSIVKNVIAQDTPTIELDNTNSFLMKLFVSEVIKRNKLFTNDAEKNAAAKELFLEADKKRTDKQIGSNPNSSGTTSLAVKGGAPSAIGWAVENGGATSSINGNTVTVRINPLGLTRALSREGFLGNSFVANATKAKRDNIEFEDVLRKFSVGLSFDTTRGTEFPTFIGSKQQLSAVSFRYEFINQRNPQSKRAQNLFREFVDANTANLDRMVDISLRLKNENTGTYKNQALQEWLIVTNREIANIPNPAKEKLNLIGKLSAANNDKLNDLRKIQQRLNINDATLNELLTLLASNLSLNNDRVREIVNLVDPVAQRTYEEAVRGVIEKRIAVLPVDEVLADPIVKQGFEEFIDITQSYVAKRKEFLEEVNKGAVATFEYTNNREINAPDTSNFRFIWEKGMLGTVDFTFNGSVTMFNKKPVGTNVRRLKDFQFALQADVPLPNTFGIGDSVLSFAGRYERLNSNTVDPSGLVVPNTKGDVAIGQIKLTIPIADWGIKLPLSVTFANRTELIKESKIRGNFGITFDLDPLFARFKPF